MHVCAYVCMYVIYTYVRTYMHTYAGVYVCMYLGIYMSFKNLANVLREHHCGGLMLCISRYSDNLVSFSVFV